MTKKETAITQRAGTQEIQRFGETELATTGETVASVLAARAKAEVEARFIVAMKNRRDWDTVRVEMLKACERPGFAGSATEKIWGAAWYLKPVGEGVEGFSVRFAEEALRNMKNMDARSTILWEDDEKRLVQIEVLDLENNISIPTVIVVSKTIERKYLQKGEIAISQRINSNGDVTYLRAATDDEVLQKQNSATSKAFRNGVLRLLPGDIQAQCRDRILNIRIGGGKAMDPDQAKRKIVDGFAQINVTPTHLKQYLGHDVGTCSKAELAALRDLWKAINDGKTTWSEVIAATTDGDQPDDEPKSGIDKLKDRLVPESKPDKGKAKPKAAKAKKDPEPAAPESPAEEPTPPADPEPTTDTTQDPEFDVFSELSARAKEKFGKQARGKLGALAKEHGFKLSDLTDQQASELLDNIDNMEV